MARTSTKSTTPTQAHFAKVPGAQIQRSVFRRDSAHKTAFDAGYLIPFFVEEVIPGDTAKLNTAFLARLATPIFPYMDNVFMDFHYFFVPNRLLWENWERSQGAQDDPGDSTDYLLPQLDDATHAAGFAENSIYDYMGLPTKVANIPQDDMPQAMPLRAYYMIWNEWFRDQNLQNSLVWSKGDGPDTTAFALQRRGRRKDYFTSALPWPQKGPAVSLPLAGTAPVTGIVVPSTQAFFNLGGTYRDTTGATGTYDPKLATGANVFIQGSSTAANSSPQIFADMSGVTAATINEWRTAFQLQRMLERDARGGTRYVESLLARFGVVSPDFRLQRPEFLGSSSVPVNVNPIAQTSESSGSSPQGNLSAFAVAHGKNGFNHSFVEHGFIIGLVSARADYTYQQGMHRMWSRRTRYDIYEPAMAHLGEQAVLNKEIYMQGAAGGAADNNVWGYQERWAEYRFRPSMVTAQFRSNHTVPLDSWHLALDFSALPTLAGIVTEDPPIDRIIAVPSEPHFIFDSFTSIIHARPMPTYSTPGMIDHF